MSREPNIGAGVAWYRRDQYPLLRAMAADPDSMPATYDEWLTAAAKLIEDLRKCGVTAQKVDVEVRELADWCQQQNKPLNGAARAEFATHKMK
jgi:hypothetical protein